MFYRLWSLAAQRCLHTFTHHTDSVWSLYSDHPNLERFLSGDRTGHLAAVDVTGCKTDYSDGECVLLAKVDVEEGRRGTEGISQIIGMDDEYVWTATGSASVKRWRDVGRKRDRLEAPVLSADRRSSLTVGLTPVPAAQPQPQPPAPTSPPMVTVGGFIMPQPKRTLSQAPNAASSLPAEQRDGRTVAFAETSKPTNPFDDANDVSRSSGPMLGVRKTTMSGAPIAGSIMSVASSRTGGAEYATGRNGIAYAHQVCLGLKASPQAFGSSTLDMTETDEKKAQESFLGSAMAYRRSSLARNGAPSLSSHQGQGRATPDPGDVARRDFEEREILVEADPLRDQPAEVIKGRHGLIRALILNDRQHALTVDTGGQVAVWNVIQGKCVGRYDETEISSVYQESGYDLRDIGRDSKEALDIVRERIEGESSTITWCTVDTRIGSLTVHVEENRCFDAEVYADEVGYKGDPAFKEDQRSKFAG
jgi:WD repeat-containing protein 48